MKNLILMLVVVVIFGFAGSPQLQKRVSFNFGGKSDNTSTMFFQSSEKILIGGIYSGQMGAKASLMLINPDGEQNWVTLDTSPVTSSISIGRDSCIYWSTVTGFLKKSNDSGKVVWNKKFGDNWIYVFCYKGLPTISVGGSSPKIIFLNEGGEQTKQIPISTERVQGSWLPRLHGNKLWLFGTPNSTTGTTVLLLDLESGEKIWEKYFPLNVRTTGTVDSNGNGYLVASRAIFKDSPIKEMVVTKLDSTGQEMWSKSWFPRETDLTNMENWINGVTVSLGKNLLVVSGSIQKGGSHSSDANAYLAGLNISTGKLEWSQIINYRDGLIEAVRAVQFIDAEKLAVLSFSLSNIDFNPPNLLYLDTYEVDRVLAVGDSKPALPIEFRLEQNYPNPFNPNTTIRYSVSNRQYVNLTVYDLLGREIAVLVSGEIETGGHEAHFNAANLPSGTYLYRLQTADRVETKKMVLLK